MEKDKRDINFILVAPRIPFLLDVLEAFSVPF